MADKKVKKVLIAEDEKPMAHALELKLQKAGYEVIVKHDGADALAALEQDHFDVVLLDLMMPKVDGFGVLKALQEKGNKTPVIVTSNLGQEEDSAKAKSLGAVEYLIKSNTPITEIITHIQKVTGS